MLLARVVECLVMGEVAVLPRVSCEDLEAWPDVLDTRAADPSVTCLVQDDIEHPADHTFMFGPLGEGRDFDRWWVDLCSTHRAALASTMSFRSSVAA